MPKALISIIIPSYNRAHTLQRALDSILMQDYRPIEIIIVDDSSTDDTQDFLKKYKQTHGNKKQVSWIFLRNSKNLGIGRARNVGMKEVKGEFIAFLDSDDEWIRSDKLSMQVEFLEKNPEYGFVATAWQVMNPGVDNHSFCFTDDSSFRKIALERYPAHTSTWVFKKSIYEQIGGFWKYRAEDYEYILRIGTVTKCYCIKIVTEKYQNESSGDYQKKQIRSFFVGLFICYRYCLKYPCFFSAITKRIQRGFLKSINKYE